MWNINQVNKGKETQVKRPDQTKTMKYKRLTTKRDQEHLNIGSVTNYEH